MKNNAVAQMTTEALRSAGASVFADDALMADISARIDAIELDEASEIDMEYARQQIRLAVAQWVAA